MDAQVEPAQRAGDGAQTPLHHVDIAGERRIARVGHQNGDGQAVLERLGQRKSHVGRARDQAQAFGDHVNGFGPGGRQERLGGKGGHFRACVPALVRPARAVAQIEKGGIVHAKLGGEFLEHGALLLAGDDHIARLHFLCGMFDLLGTEGGVDTAATDIISLTNFIRIKRLTARAITQEQFSRHENSPLLALIWQSWPQRSHIKSAR